MKGRAGRWRAWLLIGVALVVATGVTMATSGPTNSTPLDPGNAGPGGTRAVAKVLAQEGVDVAVARSAAELEDLRIGADTGVVVVLPDYLGPSTAERLLAHAAGSARVLVVGVGPASLELFGDSASLSRGNLNSGRDAACLNPLFQGLRIEVESSFLYGGGDCFNGGGGVVRSPRPGLMFFGAEGVFTNDEILRADNAAVALRLLGQDERLVWYVPSLVDLSAGEAVTARSLLPPWILPGLWLVGLAAVAVMLWRGRRLGPLAMEPLPVVVRAVETTRSLGGLYRRTGDRAHAAATLRESTRRRLGDRLGLGVAAAPDDVVRQVTARSGRDQSEVAGLLQPDPGAPGPASDQDLINLARELAELDREVRRS